MIYINVLYLHILRFEKASPDGKGFERHVRNDHNIWGYLSFIIHLYRKVRII